MPEAQGLSLREAEAMHVLGGRSEDLWEPQPEKTGHRPTVIHPRETSEAQEALDTIHQRTSGQNLRRRRRKRGEGRRTQEEEGRGEERQREGRRVKKHPEAKTGGEGWPRAPEEVGQDPVRQAWGLGLGPQDCGCTSSWVGAGGQDRVPEGPWTMLRLWVFIWELAGAGLILSVAGSWVLGVKDSCQDTRPRHHLCCYPCGGWGLVGKDGGSCRTEKAGGGCEPVVWG